LEPRAAIGHIALIDESGAGDGGKIARALAEAGYDVRYGADGQAIGTGVVVRVSSSTSSSSGTRDRVPISAVVLGERRDTDDAQRIADRQKMDAIARLAGGIAHDFNNLLAVISVCTDEVLDSIEPTENVRACLEDIRRAVDRGSVVTRDLLAFSQRDIQAPRLVDINEIVTTSHRMIERMVGGDIRIESTLGATAPFVRIDPGQWSSVFANLALNARSAMLGGGTLSLHTRNVTLDPRERGHDMAPGSYLEIEVTDTGCGMTDDVRARIFEPFFTTKGEANSAGLGLAVVHGVVAQSNGFIEVTSDVGRGTTFRLYVPAAKDHPVTETRRRVVPEPRDAAVLVVEDEPSVRRIAVRALERGGYRVFQAGSAEEALANAEAGPIDLLVTDIMLPGMDGRRLAEALTSRIPGLAVLYTSGYTSDHVIRLGVARSELAFLPKPYSAKDLVERAADVLAKTRG